jgi:hypothetical protein
MSLTHPLRISDALTLTSAGREHLKWLALLLMTGDHVNKVLFDGGLAGVSELARVVFPIFAMVLAYNLYTHRDPSAAGRSLTRLLVAAAVAQPFHALAFGYTFPLNVLFTLALGVYVSTERSRALGLLAWLVGGLFVDYGWMGAGVVVATTWLLRSQGHWTGWAGLVATVAALWVTNGNVYALGAFPLVWWLGRSQSHFPRAPWVFLGYYVAHLAVLALAAFSGDVFPAVG